MGKEITETKIDINSINDTTSLGGAASLDVKVFKERGMAQEFTVIGVDAVQTNWGVRIDYVIVDIAGFEHRLSSWNFQSKKKFKPLELLNKTILLEPGKHEKKLLLSF